MNICYTIGNLLRFIKVENGIIKVQTISKEWIPVSDYGKVKQSFSARLFSNVDSQMQMVKLRDFLYENFYILGRDSFSPQQAQVMPALKDLIDVSLDLRPPRVNFAVYKNKLTNGQAILAISTSQFLIKSGEWGRNAKGIDGLEVVEIFSEKARTNEPEDRNTWLVSDGMHHGFAAENQLIRFYFNPFPAFTEQIAHTLIKYLDAYGIQFQLKYLRPEIISDRCDKIVMYIPQRQFMIASWIVIHVYGSFKSYFTQRLPLFIREIYPGIGFAEEPFTNDSFGKSRCLWIASAVQQWSIRLGSGASAMPQVKHIVDEIFNEQKLSDLEKIYLNPESHYPYDFRIFHQKSNFKGNHHWPNKYLETAVAIGNFICREAIWKLSGKVTWISAVADNEENPFYRVLGDDWERGITGPLLFLHVLHKYSADPLYDYVAKSAETSLPELLERGTAAFFLCDLYNHVPSEKGTYDDLGEKLKKNLKEHKVLRAKGVSVNLVIEKVGTPQREIFEEIVKILNVDCRSDLFDWLRFVELLDQVKEQPNLFLTNEMGWDEFFPGMNGLSLLGFSYLLAFDPTLPIIPLGDLRKES